MSGGNSIFGNQGTKMDVEKTLLSSTITPSITFVQQQQREKSLVLVGKGDGKSLVLKTPQIQLPFGVKEKEKQKNSDKNCAQCQKENCKWKCGKCCLIYYCSKDCQVRHWKRHKLLCGMIIFAENKDKTVGKKDDEEEGFIEKRESLVDGLLSKIYTERKKQKFDQKKMRVKIPEFEESQD